MSFFRCQCQVISFADKGTSLRGPDTESGLSFPLSSLLLDPGGTPSPFGGFSLRRADASRIQSYLVLRRKRTPVTIRGLRRPGPGSRDSPLLHSLSPPGEWKRSRLCASSFSRQNPTRPGRADARAPSGPSFGSLPQWRRRQPSWAGLCGWFSRGTVNTRPHCRGLRSRARARGPSSQTESTKLQIIERVTQCE